MSSREWLHLSEGNDRADGRTVAGSALHVEPAAERRDPVREASQPATTARVGAPYSIVGHLHYQVAVPALHCDRRAVACAYLATFVSASATTK